jgi:hypothetical protein
VAIYFLLRVTKNSQRISLNLLKSFSTLLINFSTHKQRKLTTHSKSPENQFMNKVLILGAGLVVKPMVEYLLENKFSLLIASPMKERADEIINGNPLGSSLDWSMDDPAMLEKIVAEHDISVSLLPYKYHTDVAKACLIHEKSLVTTSYVQPEMMALDEAAKKAGVLFLNEIGLDPGIDHMSAMRIIDHIHNKGGKVEQFYSLCGALPAPEATGNPMKYKFSWSPKGVILASRNSALYLKKCLLNRLIFLKTGLTTVSRELETSRYILTGIPSATSTFMEYLKSKPCTGEPSDIKDGAKPLM